MTNWDPLESLDDALGIADLILLSGLCAIVWLICAPVGIYARLRCGAKGDDGCHGADWGNERFHGGDF